MYKRQVFVFILFVHTEADPETGDVIDAGGNPRMVAQAAGQFALQQIQKAGIGHRLDFVFRFGGQ